MNAPTLTPDELQQLKVIQRLSGDVAALKWYLRRYPDETRLYLRLLPSDKIECVLFMKPDKVDHKRHTDNFNFGELLKILLDGRSR